MVFPIHPYERQHCWLPIGSPGHNPCSPHAAPTPSWTGRTLGNLLVAVLSTPMKHKPIVLMTVTALMDTKYELAHTQWSILTHGSTRNFRTLVPWLLPSSSVTALAFSSSAVLTTFNQIITPERPQAALILDLTAIFWFPVNRNIHWQAMVDPMATLPIPPGHGLVDANLI